MHIAQAIAKGTSLQKKVYIKVPVGIMYYHGKKLCNRSDM